MLIELQTLLVNRSILSKAQLLADDLDQWPSVLSQSNPGNGKRIWIPHSWRTDGTIHERTLSRKWVESNRVKVYWSFLMQKFFLLLSDVSKIIGIENTQPQQQSLCYVFIKYSPSRKVSPSCGWQVRGFVIPLYPSKTMVWLFMMQFAMQTDRSFVLISCCFALGSFSLMIFRFSYGT